MAIILPAKPLRGQPCNGCGVCCAIELCELGTMMFPGVSAPCPALKLAPDNTRTYCGVVLAEQVAGVEPLLARGLGIGLGCSMDDS